MYIVFRVYVNLEGIMVTSLQSSLVKPRAIQLGKVDSRWTEPVAVGG